MAESLHRKELRYARAQMIIAALNLAATSVISITGLWIAHEVNANADSERRHERAQDELRLRQQAANERANTRNDLIAKCITLKLSERQQRASKTELSFEMQKISDIIRTQCKTAGLDFDELPPGLAHRVFSDGESMTAVDIVKFLAWASISNEAAAHRDAKP